MWIQPTKLNNQNENECLCSTKKMEFKLPADHSQLCCSVTYVPKNPCSVQNCTVETTELMGTMELGHNTRKCH